MCIWNVDSATEELNLHLKTEAVLGQLRELANYKVEHSSQQHPHSWHQLQVQEFPNTTLTFDNLLKVLTEFTESYYTHSYSLLQGKDTD